LPDHVRSVRGPRTPDKDEYAIKGWKFRECVKAIAGSLVD
jgi:hypothetical protein